MLTHIFISFILILSNQFILLYRACLVLAIRDKEYQFNVFCYQNKSINPTSCFSALRLFTSEKAFNPNNKLNSCFPNLSAVFSSVSRRKPELDKFSLKEANPISVIHFPRLQPVFSFVFYFLYMNLTSSDSILEPIRIQDLFLKMLS